MDSLSIEFQMSLLLFVAMLGYILAARIGQSVVIGEILVGLAVGPSVLGWITYTDFVESIGHLGAVVLLFVIGTEFKFNEIFNVKYGVIAAVGVVLPWLGGYLISLPFGYSHYDAIFIGTALTATSIAITANVLKEMGKIDTSAAKAIIGAAVIDDVLSLLALTLTLQVVRGDINVASFVLLIVKAFGFIVVGAVLGYRFFTKQMERMDEKPFSMRYPEFVFIVSMTIAFFYSTVAELIGLSAIIGAFIAGVSLESANLRHSKDFRVGADYLRIIFSAIFFVSLGILVDFHALDFSLVSFLLALTLIAILTKLAGCAIPAKMQGFTTTDSLIVGVGMSPRGEVAMIVALIGLTAGLIGQEIYTVIVLMSLITTLITPLLLKRLY